MVLGEEVNHQFVADVLKVGVDQWNHCIRELRKKLENDPEVLLSLVLRNMGDRKSESEMEDSMERLQDVMSQRLFEISVKETDGNLLKLNFIIGNLDTTPFFIIIYTYIYIYSCIFFIYIQYMRI